MQQDRAAGEMSARNLYITAMEPASGKSVVSLGLMELLAPRVDRLGFFRPIIPAKSGRDPQIELIHNRYRLELPYEQMYALTENEAAGIDDYDELKKRVVEAYKEVERQSDFVLCEGTDFAGPATGLDFGRNADLANELGAPVLVVVRGPTPDDAETSVQRARGALEQKGCSIFGVLVNRVPAATLAETSQRIAAQDGKEPVYIVPEHAELAVPTFGEVASQLGGDLLAGTPESLQREVRELTVGAASVDHFLDELVEGAVVIAPSDRPDIVVASLACAVSPALPTVSGIVLTDQYELGSSVRRLLESAPFPVLKVPLPTHAVAAAIQGVRPLIQPEDERKIATALGVFESAVDFSELEQRLSFERPSRVTPIMFEYELVERAKEDRRHIVLPEGDDDRVLRAAEILLRREVVDLTILGTPADVKSRAGSLGVDIAVATVVDPLESPLRDQFASQYFDLRKHKGITEDQALDAVANPNYFGTLLVHAGEVDGMVSGASHTTGETIRPAFEIIRAREGVSVVSSVFFMCLADRVLVYGDCAVNPSPNAEQLADIAISSSETASSFGIDPRLAMLSYSTGTSGKGETVDLVREATNLVRERRPDLMVEGPIQYDAAVDASVAQTKLPESEVAGRATVFIFPDLDTGNVAYKAVQRSASAVAIGPVLQGLNKPVNDLSRGCLIADIVNTVAITAIQAQT
jgi:phosphate acetyltransferase